MASAPPIVMKVDPDSIDQDQPANNGAFGFLDGIQRSQTMLGGMWGLRPWLSQYGMSFNLQETSEELGNVSGGSRQGFDYDGLTQMAAQMDTQRAFGWYGGTFNASALQIHGSDLSAKNLDTLQTSSGIESPRATRLWELWYQQKFLDEDRLDIKLGQQSLDQEFMVSSNSNYFMNTMMGWPMLPSADMPNGGPAYPLSALGVRARGKPNDSITILGGVFNGSPANKSDVNDSGTGFPLDGGVLAIAEVQYAYPSLGGMVSADSSGELSGTYKFGVWYDSENFADQEYGTDGLSLANPASNGNPAMHHGDYGIYAVADQMLWASENLEDRTLNFFTRVMGTPETDRNLIDFSMNAGFTLHEPIPLRDSDTLGIGVGYADVSNRAVGFDQDTASYNPGTYTPIRSSETFVEATYQYQVLPWWQVQPDIQYVFNPGAGAVDDSGQRIKNEAIIGLRTNISF
ncbi:MAG: carbohydrate porin [Alphaproteobacteria bacterium]